MTPTILGIDPGVTGAIAMVSPMVEVWDMPETALQLALLLDTFDPATTRAYVEQVHSMPKQGVASTFKFGMDYGMLLGILAAMKIPYILVPPSKWKPAMGLRGAEKVESRRKAQELFPTAPLSRVKDHGRAEALLLAEWGRRQP
jgi:crossover junction endodeoxyribonuclease RuvC